MEPPRLSGFIQAHYRHAFPTGVDGVVDHDDFRVQRARVGIEGKVFRWLGYDLEIDPRAPEITGVLRDAFISFHVLPRHEIRLGQQKTQFGYENVESSTHLYAVNRTEVSDNLSRGVTLRDIGLGIVGSIKLGGGFRLEDAATLVNGAGMNVQDDDTPGKDVWGRLGVRYKNRRAGKLDVRLGASGAFGDHVDEGDDPLLASDDFRLKFRRLGADIEIDQDWFFVSSELVLGWDHDMVTGERDEPMGYYVNVVAKTPWEVGPLARYDAFGDEYARFTFGAFYGLPKAHFRVLLNYEYRQKKDDVRGDDKAYAWVQVHF